MCFELVLKDITYRFFTLLLSAVLLVSASGFTADFHYCQGHLKSYSLVGKAEACHNKKVSNACPFHQNLPDEKEDDKNCCENETKHFQSDEDLFFQNTSLELGNIDLVYAQVPALDQLNHFKLEEDFTSTDFFYKPPLIERDLPVLMQSFLL